MGMYLDMYRNYNDCKALFTGEYGGEGVCLRQTYQDVLGLVKTFIILETAGYHCPSQRFENC